MTHPARSEVDLRPRHTVETPEQVALAYEVAGLGSRGLASIIDHLLLIGAWIGLSELGALGHWATAPEILLTSALALGYFAAFETWWQGQTPGKRALGIRVVLATGHPATLSAILTRNILRAADFLPPPYVSGILFIFFHPRAQRLGDLAGGTLVVRDRPVEVPAAPAPIPAPAPGTPLGVAALTAEEYQLLQAFEERASTLSIEAMSARAAVLAARFTPRFADRPVNDLAFLRQLYAHEHASRAAGGGEARERSAFRLAERQRGRWHEFEQLATRAATRGLDSFSAAELPDFAARYREVSADLARARTYRAPSATRSALERLNAAGHDALYRDPARMLARTGDLLLRQAPASVIRAWREVLLALLLLFVPATVGWTVIRHRPTLAEEVLPDVMLQRAAAARARQRAGLTYFETDANGATAAWLFTHNVRVALLCFASGIFLGVGSLLLLATNGASLGVAAGHFANVGVLGYLLSFIVGHGFLELFAIAVAGAAGFILGFSLLAPGPRSRGDALARAGRRALPMVGASASLLALAGMIEGMVSATNEGLGYRLAISGASVVVLVLYLVNGWRHRGDAATA